MTTAAADLAALLFPPLFAKAVLAAVCLLLADALFGMLVALKAHTFTASRVSDYLSQDNAIKILAWIVLTEVVALADYANVGLDFGGLTTFVGASAAVTVVGPLFAEFVLKALKLFGTVPLDAALAMRRAKPRANATRSRAHPAPVEPVEVEHVAHG